MSKIRKLGPVVCAALLIESMVFFQGCAPPGPQPNLFAHARNPAGQIVCTLQTFVPSSLKRGASTPYGLQVVVPFVQVADVEVSQTLDGCRQAGNAPSPATGDFAFSWALHTPSQPPYTLCFYWWYVYSNIGYRGVETYTSQGTFTPVLHPNCTSGGCTTGGTLSTQIGVACKSVGGVPYTPGSSGTWTVTITP